jgi:hypothetical protein
MHSIVDAWHQSLALMYTSMALHTPHPACFPLLKHLSQAGLLSLLPLLQVAMSALRSLLQSVVRMARPTATTVRQHAGARPQSHMRAAARVIRPAGPRQCLDLTGALRAAPLLTAASRCVGWTASATRVHALRTATRWTLHILETAGLVSGGLAQV